MPESTKSPAEVLGADDAAVKNIVRALTKVQRSFVEAGCIHGDFRMSTVRILRSKGLFERRDLFPGSTTFTLELSPLGKAAQALIKSRQASIRGGEA